MRWPLRSIRARLLASLLTVVVLAALLTGAISYRNVLQESESLFDYQLQQMALSLRDQGAISSDQASALKESGFDFVIQIWSFDGELIYASRRDTGLPPHAVLGFADVKGRDTTWRVFSTVASSLFGDRVIQVAQPLRIRRQLAASAALRSATPLLAAGPLLAIAIWAIVAASLKPLQRVTAELSQRSANALTPLAEEQLPNLPDEVAPLVNSLNNLLARLDAAFRGQRDFVADAAHELRSPLTALKLQLALLEKTDQAEPRAQATAELKRGIDRATRLVEQLLALARNEAGAEPLKSQPLDLVEIARNAVVDTVALASAKQIDIALEAPIPPERVEVQGDPQALFIAARNLADNAVRYTPNGGQVRVSISTDEQGATLTVDDTGPGIPVQERERVFDRFYRRLNTVDTNTDAGHLNQGSGLGLAIVKGIAQRHGAQLLLGESALGGLRVTLRLARITQSQT